MTGGICSIKVCQRPVYGRGWCNAHYLRWRRHGDPVLFGGAEIGASRHKDPTERVWTKVDKDGPGGCWLWTGGIDHYGYGWSWDGQRKVKAHRHVYELEVGPIPEGLVIDHLCRVRHCVNPEHLEPVTNKENLLRGVGPSSRAAQAARAARQTHQST